MRKPRNKKRLEHIIDGVEEDFNEVRMYFGGEEKAKKRGRPRITLK